MAITLTQARVTAIRNAPQGVKPTVSKVGEFLALTLAGGGKQGQISTTIKAAATDEQFEAFCRQAAASFEKLPAAKVKSAA